MNEEKVAYIKFFAPVVPASINHLMNIIDDKIRQGYKRIVLLISTPGGSVFHGLTVYNYLKGLNITIETHNFGSVDSIGTVIFCAGSKRYSVPNARFLLHPVSFTPQPNQQLEEKNIVELLNSLQVDETNISSVISNETGKSLRTVKKTILDRTTLLPQAAIRYGLVHEIKIELIPENADLTSINMS